LLQIGHEQEPGDAKERPKKEAEENMAKRRKTFGSGAFAKARRGDSSGVFIVDDVTSFYTIASVNFPQATARALRHVSFLMMHSAKRYMANDSHGKPVSDLTRSRVLDRFAGRGSTRRKKFAGDLSGGGRGLQRAIKYDSQRGDPLSYLIGWASNDARRVSGPRFQAGKNTRKMNPTMRKFLQAAALAQPERSKFRKILLSMASKEDGYEFDNPARPVIDPTYNRWQSKILPIFEQRLLRNLNKLEDEAYDAFLLDFTAPDKNAREAAEIAQGIRTRAGNRRRRKGAA
jgi:hypothetical protein